MDADTIFAVASGAGHAAIAVMRLSGPGSRAMLAALCGRVPAPRRVSLRRRAANVDQAMVVWLPGPGSYTGEDSAEFYLHGGRSVLNGMADALVALGARPAEPGEFTRRAFLNGRMDLTEAEAVHDLIAAETEAQRRQALRQLDGALGTTVSGVGGAAAAAVGAAGGADRFSRRGPAGRGGSAGAKRNCPRCGRRWPLI